MLAFLKKLRERVEEAKKAFAERVIEFRERVTAIVEEQKKVLESAVAEFEQRKLLFEKHLEELQKRSAEYVEGLRLTLNRFTDFLKSCRSSTEVLIKLPNLRLGKLSEDLLTGLRLRFEETLQGEREEESQRLERYYTKELENMRKQLEDLQLRMERERAERRLLSEEVKQLKAIMLENDVAFLLHAKYGYSVRRRERIKVNDRLVEFDIIGKKLPTPDELYTIACECKRYTTSPLSYECVGELLSRAEMLQNVLRRNAMLYRRIGFQYWIVSTAGFERKEEILRRWKKKLKFKLIDLDELRRLAAEAGYRLTCLD